MYAPFFRSFYCFLYDDQRFLFHFFVLFVGVKVSKANAKIEKLNSKIDINFDPRK